MLQSAESSGVALHHPCWNSHHGGSVRNRMNHHRAGPYFHVIAQTDVSQYRSPGPDHDAVAQRGMAFPALVAGAAQGHALVQEHVIANLGRLADHHAQTMIDEQTLADLRPRVDL